MEVYSIQKGTRLEVYSKNMHKFRIQQAHTTAYIISTYLHLYYLLIDESILHKIMEQKNNGHVLF